MKKICIDARLYGISHTGIGRYIQNLILNLPNSNTTEIILIVSPESSLSPELNVFKKHVALHHPYAILSQFEMLFLLLKIKPDLLHVPHFTIPILWRGKIISTIHDLIKNEIKGSDTSTRSPIIYWPKYLGYLIILRLCIMRSLFIIVPTNYWQNKLVEKYHLSVNKIKVTYEGVSDIFLDSKKVIVKNPDGIVYTGNLYPHKNVSMLVDVCNQLKINLTIVCARTIFEKRLKPSKYVKYAGRLSDEDLISLYKSSFTFVIPSLIEGFGLTGLEAMAVGLPVISSNATCLPEVYGDAALYFDPHSPESLIDQVLLLQTSKSLRLGQIKKGHECVKNYSWSKMSKQTWELYQNVLQ